MQLTAAELALILLALNDREGVLACDYEQAIKIDSKALVTKIAQEMGEVRALATAINNRLALLKLRAA